jgi:hypothetical protein
MHFLIRNVLLQRLNLGRANRKHTIACLPLKLRQIRRFRLDPLRRIAFQLPQENRQGYVLRQPAEKVHVIFNTADNESRRFQVLANTGEIGMSFGRGLA